MADNQLEVTVEQAVAAVSSALDCDILIYSGGMNSDCDTLVSQRLADQVVRRPNVLLMLTTYGGQADVAYRIARSMQRAYRGGKFYLFVNSFCKSAGTLIALGADVIIMADCAELGPLDVQLGDREEVGEMRSGLTPNEALATLRRASKDLFHDHFKALRFTGDYRFSTKLAAQLATEMTIGLLNPIYQQVDPTHLGETQRAVMIAAEYGSRLQSENVRDETVAALVGSYPTHGFVIDREEAEELFYTVRAPSADEVKLAEVVAELVDRGQESDLKMGPACVEFLLTGTEEAYNEKDEKSKGAMHVNPDADSRDRAKTAAGGPEDSAITGPSGPGSSAETTAVVTIPEVKPDRVQALRHLEGTSKIMP